MSSTPFTISGVRDSAAVIAVSDSGIGFRRSLEPTQAKRYGDRWRDGTALEAALIQGVSRFRDPGRGQGLAGIKRYLQRWQGKISARSGASGSPVGGGTLRMRSLEEFIGASAGQHDLALVGQAPHDLEHFLLLGLDLRKAHRPARLEVLAQRLGRAG